MLAALLLAICAAQGPGPLGAPPPPLEVVEAGRVEYDVSTGRVVATGGVVLRRGAVTLRAAEARYDAASGEVDASGAVLLTEPGRAVAASAMHAVLDGPYEARDVIAFLKSGPMDLSTCRTLDEARAKGRNGATVGGALVRGGAGARRFEVDRARITTCDCGAAAPSWEIRSSHASVTPGEGALLRWPVLYVTPRFLFVERPIPVFAFPVLYLPLSDRQTGLLMPALTLGGTAYGFAFSEPFFLTLGPSWDLTVTGTWFLPPSGATVAALHRGVQGPGGALELRWAPAEGVDGRARFSLFHSLISDWPGGAARPPGMNRLSLAVQHDQRFTDATYLKVDGAVVGDPYYPLDFTADVLARALEYRRSGLALTHRSADGLLEADATYLEPVQSPFAGVGAAGGSSLDACVGQASCPVRAPFGPFGADVPTFHRLPSASAMLLPVRLAGPVLASGSIGVARFAPVHGSTGDEGEDAVGPGQRGWPGAAGPGGAPCPAGVTCDPTELDGRWQRTERLAATRVAARVDVSAPFSVGRALAVEPWVTGTALGYAFQAALDPQLDARAVAGLALSTVIGRTFGAGAGALRHEIEPRLRLVAGTPQAGPGLPNYAYDELDVAAPLPGPAAPGGTVPVRRTLSAEPGGFQQLQVAVRQRLVAPAGPLSTARAELALGQDVDAGRGELSETWAQLALRIGRLSADATARFRAFGAHAPPGAGPATPNAALPPSWLDRFTQLSASAVLSDARGDNVHVGFLSIAAGGSPRLLAGLEPIFDPRPFAFDPQASAGAGVAVRASGAVMTYDLALNPRELAAPLCAGKSTAPHVYQHSATMVWDSPCRCWKAGLTLVVNECLPGPQVGFIVDLSSLADRRVGG